MAKDNEAQQMDRRRFLGLAGGSMLSLSGLVLPSREIYGNEGILTPELVEDEANYGAIEDELNPGFGRVVSYLCSKKDSRGITNKGRNIFDYNTNEPITLVLEKGLSLTGGNARLEFWDDKQNRILTYDRHLGADPTWVSYKVYPKERRFGPGVFYGRARFRGDTVGTHKFRIALVNRR